MDDDENWLSDFTPKSRQNYLQRNSNEPSTSTTSIKSVAKLVPLDKSKILGKTFFSDEAVSGFIKSIEDKHHFLYSTRDRQPKSDIVSSERISENDQITSRLIKYVCRNGISRHHLCDLSQKERET